MKRSLLTIFIAAALVQCGNLPPEQSSVRSMEQDTGKYYSYPWLKHYDPERKVLNVVQVPDGFTRISAAQHSFTHWLRNIPVSKDQEVHLYNGALKGNQDAQFLILDLDVGSQDLQQCADACMRLRAEYLYATKAYSNISFHFTSGFKAEYKRWAEGERILVQGNKVSWVKKTGADYSYSNFRNYMDQVFMYAGTQSLSQELRPVPADSLRPGDLLIKGGFPGHAVMIMDVARNSKGEKIFLLAQSYMPAQQIHLLNNPDNSQLSPWYRIPADQLETPEWTFQKNQVMRWK